MLKKRSRPRKNSRNKENKMTLSRFSKIVYEHKVTTVTNGQARKYKSYTGELIKFFGDIELEDIELADAYQFVNYLKYEKRQYEGVKQRENWNKIGLKSSSVNDYIVTLSSAINLMYDLEYLNEDNFKNVFSKVKKLKEDKAKPRQVPADDLKQFLKVLDTQYYTDLRMKTVVYALLESYCRVNELCNLKIDDIDFQTGLITFNKTKNSNFRVVPVSKKVLSMLKFFDSATVNRLYYSITNALQPYKGREDYDSDRLLELAERGFNALITTIKNHNYNSERYSKVKNIFSYAYMSTLKIAVKDEFGY